MQNIWHITGEKAGEFETVSDAKAAELCKTGAAQIADGITPLRYPEGHPHYGMDAPEEASPKKTTRKKTYANKMAKTDDA